MEHTILNLIQSPIETWDRVYETINWSDRFYLDKYPVQSGINSTQLLILENKDFFLKKLFSTEKGEKILKGFNSQDILSTWTLASQYKNYKALEYLTAWQLFPHPSDCVHILSGILNNTKARYSNQSFSTTDYKKIYGYIQGIYEKNTDKVKKDNNDYLIKRVIDTGDFNFYKFFFENKVIKIKTEHLIDFFSKSYIGIDSIDHNNFPQPFQKIDSVHSYTSFWNNLFYIMNDPQHKINTARVFPLLLNQVKSTSRSETFINFMQGLIASQWNNLPEKENIFKHLFEEKKAILSAFEEKQYQIPFESWKALQKNVFDEAMKYAQKKGLIYADAVQYEKALLKYSNKFVLPYFNNYSSDDKQNFILAFIAQDAFPSTKQAESIYEKFLRAFIKSEALNITWGELKTQLAESKEPKLVLEVQLLKSHTQNTPRKIGIL